MVSSVNFSRARSLLYIRDPLSSSSWYARLHRLSRNSHRQQDADAADQDEVPFNGRREMMEVNPNGFSQAMEQPSGDLERASMLQLAHNSWDQSGSHHDPHLASASSLGTSGSRTTETSTKIKFFYSNYYSIST